MVEAIAKAGYTGKVVIGMDVAASEFYGAEDKVCVCNYHPPYPPSPLASLIPELRMLCAGTR